MNSTSEPTEQAKLITNYRIPYPVAAGCVKEMTPSVLEALIGVMSGQELINNIASIKKHGAFQHGNLKATVVGKLLEAKKDVKVQALKAQRAKEAGSSDDHEISSVLDEVTDARLSLVKISKPTALLVDKSGSMEEAISIAKKLASLIAQATTSDFHCYVFDTLSREIPRPSEGDTYSSWEKAFKEVRAYGGTSIGIALREMAEVGVKVEQIVIVTDARENCRPFFSEAYAQYEKATGMRPNVVVVHTKIYSPLFSKNLEKLGIPVDTYDFTGDYYSLPNILPMLGKDSTLDLLKEILNMKLEVAKVGEAG
ncbi:MAG: VWA domain-containing protein [Candidatus Riesia sp.]|nr:VWA domain-containing protein [Candidatus Riesia sp.]